METESVSIGAFDAAKRIDVTPDTITRWSREGKIKYHKDERGRRRYSVSEVERIAHEVRRSKPPARYRCVLALLGSGYAEAFTSDGWSVYTMLPNDVPNLCKTVSRQKPELVILQAEADSDTLRIAETLLRNPVKNLWLVLHQGYAPQSCRAIRPGESPETMASLAAAEFAAIQSGV